MTLIIWSLIFILSLIILLKSADWLTEGMIRLSCDLKLPAFLTGLLVISLGTSLPELSAGLVSVSRARPELAVAIAIGSTIANILLIVGVSVISAKTLIVRDRLIDVDASLFATSVVLFVFAARDGVINALEGIILLIAFGVYALYLFGERGNGDLTSSDLITPELLDKNTGAKMMEVLPTRLEKKKSLGAAPASFDLMTWLVMIVGILGLIVGSLFVVDALVNIADLVNVSGTLVGMTMLAIGVALPELFVAITAASKKTFELALGNVFGSSIINLLLVVGVCSLFGALPLDPLTFTIGLPFLLAAAILLIVSGISKKIHSWEGVMYLLVYFFFIVKLFNLF